MTWLLLSLGGAAGLFYGLWQRSRASRFQSEWKRAAAAFGAEAASHGEDVRRLEAVVASLKHDLDAVGEIALANATNDELRARLTDLLRPHP